MVTVTVMLKKNKVNQDGEMPVYIRVIKGRKSKFISLGLKVHPSKWDASKLRVTGKYPNSARVNAFIGKKVSEAEIIAVSMETNEKYVTSNKIKEAILGRKSVSLIKFAEDHMAVLKAKGQMGTHDKDVNPGKTDPHRPFQIDPLKRDFKKVLKKAC